MKKIINVLILLFLLLGSTWFFKNYYSDISLLFKSRCFAPIYYSIGDVDLQFKVSAEKLLYYSQQAAGIWENESDWNLFEYTPKANLTVNMVYDERQSLLNEVSGLQEDMSLDQETLSKEIYRYKALVAEFQEKLKNYNEKVNFWNSQGGAPEDEYTELNREVRELKSESQSLNQVASRLNLQAENYNIKVYNFNQNVQDFNDELLKKPEEGLYSQKENKIDIYLNVNDDEIIHTIAHEFGHALGVDHIYINEESIMYPYTSDSLLLSNEDKNELNNICKTTYIKYKLRELFFH